MKPQIFDVNNVKNLTPHNTECVNLITESEYSGGYIYDDKYMRMLFCMQDVYSALTTICYPRVI